MARISVKYPIGTKVITAYGNGSEGIITAIFVRGKGRSYEYSYIDVEGNPTSRTVEEVEIIPAGEKRPMGYK